MELEPYYSSRTRSIHQIELHTDTNKREAVGKATRRTDEKHSKNRTSAIKKKEWKESESFTLFFFFLVSVAASLCLGLCVGAHHRDGMVKNYV